MTKRIALLSLVGLVACSRQSDAPKPSEGTQQAAAQAPTVEQNDTANDKLDPAKIKAFIAYREGVVGYYDEMRKTGKKIEQREQQVAGSTLKLLAAQVATANDVVGASDKLEALQKKLGLSQREVDGFWRVAAAVSNNARMKGVDIGAATAELDKMMASIPKDAPPEARAEMQAQLDEIRAQQKELIGMTEERESYGNAVVDAMLAEQDTLMRQDKALLGSP